MNGKKLKLIRIFTIGLLLLPFATFGGTLSFLKVTQQQEQKLSREAQLRQLAESITVRVLLDNQERGSGVLIEKDGRVYTVLTNAHVAPVAKDYRIKTPDGNSYPAEIVKLKEHDYDMELLQFTADADADYQVATLASSSSMVKQPVFAAGFSSHAPEFVFTRGELSMFPSRPLKDGYQIGYSNEVLPGMSGGPMLNGSGQLIGINGMRAYPILQDAYEFADGSYPKNKVLEKMKPLGWGVPIGRLAEVYPSFVAIGERSLTDKTATVDEVARQITVRIEQPNDHGSGVIVARRGRFGLAHGPKTYYVLTAAHVVKYKREYEVIAHDGKRYPVDYGKVQKLAGVDLAVLQFQSQESYEVATLANYNLKVDERPWVFLSGWPRLNPGEVRSSDPKLTAGRVFSKVRGALVAKDSLSLTEGRELVYSNASQRGMSGGPVLDTRGRVIGIHTAADGEGVYIMGYSLGVPVRTFLSLASRTEVKPEWLQVEKSPPPSLNAIERLIIRDALFTVQKPPPSGSARDWVNYGNQSWRLTEYGEAVEAFDKAIKLRAKLYQAWYGLGLAQKGQGNYQAAAASFEKAAKIKPTLYQAWRQRAQALNSLGQYPEALASINKAINIKPEDSILYGWRGSILDNLKLYQAAVEAYSQGIKFKPHLFLYNDRGTARHELGDYEGAIADYDKAIDINPDDATAYNNRGTARGELEDYEGAIADYDKAIDINPDDANAYNNRGNARDDLGDSDGAIADLDKAIEINPEDADYYSNRGVARRNLGDYEGAIADYSKAIEIKPDLARAYGARGILRFLMKDKQKAIEDLEKAAQLFREQGNMDMYQNLQGLIIGLQQENTENLEEILRLLIQQKLGRN